MSGTYCVPEGVEGVLTHNGLAQRGFIGWSSAPRSRVGIGAALQSQIHLRLSAVSAMEPRTTSRSGSHGIRLRAGALNELLTVDQSLSVFVAVTPMDKTKTRDMNCRESGEKPGPRL